MTMKDKNRGSWKEELMSGITRPGDLNIHADLQTQEIEAVIRQYPMRITPYFMSLIRTSQDAIARQVIPDRLELTDDLPQEDPLDENRQSPVYGLVHRYPDRVLFLVSSQCAVYCRYCMRKRMVGQPFLITDETRAQGLAYIKSATRVKEVVLSGGDPLLLETDQLDNILKKLHAMPHIELIRIHTRTPGVLPGRITDNLVEMLKQYPPLYVNIQFNHPDEITEQTKTACAKLADAGIPLGSQTVLLKGVNDDPEVMMRLMQKLLAIRVKPYYLHHPDLVKGTGHFRTPVACGLSILAYLRGRISGMGIPQYMIDLPGGGGKVALVPESVKGIENGMMRVIGLDGKEFNYPAG